MKQLIALLLVLAAVLMACSVKPPEVRFTGEKTALEREVVGTYESMTEDTWMIASTRSTGGGKAKVSPEKKKVLAALRQQKFNKDDIDEFKREGWIGENNQGFLEIRPSKDLENQETRKLVEEIVAEENSDREVIMGRVIELNASLQKTVREDVLVIFAKMNRENTLDGTWIQQPNGTWEKK